MLEVIRVNITYNLYFDMYLLCTEYEADRIKTKAVIARQKCYARQKMSKNRFGIWPTSQGHFKMSPSLGRPPIYGLPRTTFESSR